MNNQGAGALLCLVPGLFCGFPMLLILVNALAPTYFGRARRIVSTYPWRSFLLGLVNFIFFFTLATLFSESAIIPLKLMAIVSLFIVLPLMTVIGLATIAGIAGERVLDLITEQRHTPLVKLVIGIICLAFSALLPIIGWVVLLVLLIAGFGAALLALFRSNGAIPADSQPKGSAKAETSTEPEVSERET